MVMGAFIFYVIAIIVLIIFTGILKTDTFYITKNEEYDEKLNSYKQKLSSMEDNGCNKSIKNMIDYYERTNFDGNVKYKDYNMQMIDSDPFLSNFSKIKTACNLSDEVIEKYDLKLLFLSSFIQFDEIMQDYYYNYELSLKDIEFRIVFEPSLFNYEYQINRKSILAIISNLIEISSKGDNSYDE